MKFDEKQIEFILTIAKEGGISAAAKKLYLTQPALSQRLANLEQELGFRVFRRDVTPMVPTEEGALYLNTLQEMRQLHRNFQRQLEARRDGKHGCISLALSPMRAQQLLPRLFPELRRSLPGLEVRLLHGTDRAALHRLTREGTADFSINSQVYPDLVQEVVTISNFVLVVPAGHPLVRARGGGRDWKGQETATLDMVEDDLFLLNYSTQGSRIILEQYFQAQGFTPGDIWSFTTTIPLPGWWRPGWGWPFFPWTTPRTTSKRWKSGLSASRIPPGAVSTFPTAAPCFSPR